MPARQPGTPVLDEVEPAVTVLSRALGITVAEARAGLRELVRAGYVIGPREPTNAMLLAYITSYGEVPVNPATTITAVGKARRRWRAMADRATAMTLSVKRVRGAADPATSDAAETGRTASRQSAGGRARADSLSPERRREIAMRAAEARWGSRPLNGTDGGEKA